MNKKNDINNFLHVPYGTTVHGEEEIAAVNKVLRTSTQMGSHVREFEEKIAEYYKKKYDLSELDKVGPWSEKRISKFPHFLKGYFDFFNGYAKKNYKLAVCSNKLESILGTGYL